MQTSSQTTRTVCASNARNNDKKCCAFRRQKPKPVNFVDTLLQAALYIDNVKRIHVPSLDTAKQLARHPRVVGIVEKVKGYDVIVVNSNDSPPYRLSSKFDIIEWSHVKVFCKKRNRTFLCKIKGAAVSDCRHGTVRKRYEFENGSVVKLKHQTCIASNAQVCEHCKNNTHLECLNSASYFVLEEANEQNINPARLQPILTSSQI